MTAHACCRAKPMSIRQGMGKDEHDQEGRLITAEYPHLYIVNVYVPNSGDGLKRLDYRLQQWDIHFAEYLQQLAARKPVVLTGDLNCCHQEIDIHAPKKNLKSAGFTLVCFAELVISARHACELLLLLLLSSSSLWSLLWSMLLKGCWRAECLLSLVKRASGFLYAGIWGFIAVHLRCWPESISLHSHSRGHCRVHNATAICKCSCYLAVLTTAWLTDLNEAACSSVFHAQRTNIWVCSYTQNACTNHLWCSQDC